MPTTGVVIFIGDRGNPDGAPHLGRTQVRGVTDDAALNTLAGLLAGYSDAVIYKRSFTNETILNTDPPDANANVDYKAVCGARETGTGGSHSWEIPAFSGVVEEKSEGDRVTGAAMTDIIGAINANTGMTLKPTQGYVKQVK